MAGNTGGTNPIAVIDANPMALEARVATGFQFGPVTAPALDGAIRRTLALYADAEAWRLLQENGMATELSWRGPARQYAQLFRSLLADRA